MTETEAVRLAIIGGGPAGYTAAMYAARSGLEPVCIEGYASGGQILRSGKIDNFPSYPDGVSGADLAERMRAQALGFGARIVTAEAHSVDLSGSPFTVNTDDKQFVADAVIVATGANPRRLGLPSEDAFEGFGVCYCAICDGPFFAGRRVAVVGGGDAAVEEALVLTRIASSVLLVHRRNEFRANASIRDLARQNSKIEMATPYVVTEIIGQEPAGVTGLRLRDVEAGGEREEEVDGVFIAIGHEPASAMFAKWLRVDRLGYLVTTGKTTATNVPGVFAAGDVADRRYRQAVTAAATGCAAAIDAERWLIGGGTNLVQPVAAAAQPVAEAVALPVGGRR
jgi:thioredoxin reductase (NADPH)